MAAIPKTSVRRLDANSTSVRQRTSGNRRAGAKNVTSLADTAYERIKLDIIALRYQPGSYVNEAQICSDLELGRTPVHQAVLRLAIDGLLEVVPRKGIIVRPMSLQEVMASVEVRLINEPACARLAAERGSDEQFEAMAACLKRGQRMISARDITGLMNVDREFHINLAKAARNPLIEQILKRLHEQSLRFWFVSLSDPAHLNAVDQEHWEVVKALKNRDADRAEAAIRRHIESFRDHIRQSV
jgi:DNA-binding GntR family transcriptional regulator